MGEQLKTFVGQVRKEPYFQQAKNGEEVGVFPLGALRKGKPFNYTVMAFGEDVEAMRGVRRGQNVEVEGFSHAAVRQIGHGKPTVLQGIYAKAIKRR